MMSAPEVRVEPGRWRCDCGQFGWIGHGQTQGDIERWAAKHEAECPLIDLQARWDARDTALRGLIEKWRAEGRHSDGDGYYAAGCIDCADELERAIGDGRG